MLKRFFFLLLAFTILLSGASAVWDSAISANRVSMSFVLAETALDNNILQFEHIDFSAYDFSCIDLNDMHVYNDSTHVDLNISIEGTSDMADGNVSVQIDETLVAGTYTNRFYAYYNGDCTTSRKRMLLNDNNSFNAWEVTDSAVGITASIQTFDNNTSNTIKFVTNGSGDHDGYVIRSYDAISEDSFGIWLKSSNTNDQHNISILIDTMGIRGSGGTSNVDFVGNGTDWTIFTPSTNTWYYVIFKRVDATHLSAYAYNELGVSQGSIENKEANFGTFWTQPAKISLKTSNENPAHTVVYNGICIGVDGFPYLPGITGLTMGAEEYASSTSNDFNFTAIDGEPFVFPTQSFAYLVDGNLQIDFSIFSSLNSRFLFDINYSTSSTTGTGSNIIKDLNLDSDICPDQDWFDTPSDCSWDFNISPSLVSDGNYYLLGKLKVGTTTKTKASATTFQVTNDVNLLIKVPIDEQTNVKIDTNIYAYNVKYWANGLLYNFPNQRDDNAYMIPMSTEYVIISIDTNVSTQYWGRQYAIKYSTPQATDTLQPYLPPIATSVLTTVRTISTKNLKPIPNKRIKVYKTLETGRVLINDSVTDGKGETAIAFIIADLYEIEVWNNENTTMLYSEDYTTTATTSSHYIYLPEEGVGQITTPILPNISVTFLPAIKRFYTDDVNISIVINSDTNSITGIQIILQNKDLNIWDSGMDLSAPIDGNTYTINMHNIVFDENYTVNAIVIVRFEDGTEMYFNEDSYLFEWLFGLSHNDFFWLISTGMRMDFGCKCSTPDDLGTTCEPLMFMALFAIFFIIGGLAITTFRNPVGLTVLTIILASFFVFVTWLPFWIGGMMAITGIIVIFAKSRLD